MFNIQIFKAQKQRRQYYIVVSSVFVFVAVMHFLRIINEWTLELGGYVVPIWMSWVVVVLLGYLAVRGFVYGVK